jgi:hypothetical protein
MHMGWKSRRGQGFQEKLPGGPPILGFIAFLLTSFSKNCLGVLFHTPLTPHPPLRASMHKSIKVFIKFWSREQSRKYFWSYEKHLFQSQSKSLHKVLISWTNSQILLTLWKTLSISKKFNLLTISPIYSLATWSRRTSPFRVKP